MTTRVRRFLAALKPFSQVDRLVLHEVLGPTVLGFVVYTFFLMMRAVFSLVEEVLVRGLSLMDAGRLLYVTVPHVVVLTLPMSFLFGVLIGVGRLHGDNEVIALEAGGISLARLLRPVLVLSLILMSFNLWLTTGVMPEANRELRRLKIRLFKSSSLIGRIEPKVFYEDFPGMLLYVRGIDPGTGIWRGVLIFQRGYSGRGSQLVVAERGRMAERAPEAGEAPGANERPWLMLSGVTRYQFNPKDPAKLSINSSESELVQPSPKHKGTVTINLGMRERSTGELLGIVRRAAHSREGGRDRATSGSVSRRDLDFARVELQKRIAIPAACFVFGLIAVPLAIGSRATGRGRGFLISVGVIIMYYVILNNGEFLARQGRIPAFAGVWAANLLAAGTAMVLLRRKGRWLGERSRGSGWMAAAIQAVADWLQSVRTALSTGRRTDVARPPLTGSIPLALQRQRSTVRFPTLLDRYLSLRFLGPVAFVLLSVSALYIIVDLADKIDEMAKHTATAIIFLRYYWNIIPQIVLDVTPLGVLIAVLLLFSLLEKHLELTALKAGGISLYRVIVPILLVTLAATAGIAVFQESVAPRANRKAQQLLDIIKGRKAPHAVMVADRQWLFSRDGTTLFNYLRYDPERQTLIRFSMYRFDDTGKLSFQLFAERAQYVDGAWEVDSGWFRQIHPNGRDEFHKVTSRMALQVAEPPGYFAAKRHAPSEMSYRELRRHIADLAASGYHSSRLDVRLQQKLTYPFSVLIMVLLGLPFGLNRSGGRRVSAMQGVAIGLALGIGYFLLMALFGKMGEANLLPPVLGAWAPVILAGLFGINRLTTLRT